jgi:hypothetical protein
MVRREAKRLESERGKDGSGTSMLPASLVPSATNGQKSGRRKQEREGERGDERQERQQGERNGDGER